MDTAIDWNAVIFAYQSRLDEIRQNYQREVADLEASIRLAKRMLAVGPSVAEELTAATTPFAGPYADLTVVEGAVEIIAAHGRAMSYDEITAALESGGKKARPDSVKTLLKRDARSDNASVVMLGDGRFDVKRVPASVVPTTGESPSKGLEMLPLGA